MQNPNSKIQIPKRLFFKYFAVYILHFAFCIYLSGTALAADLGNLKVTSSIKPSRIKIGERIDFMIAAEHDSGIDIFYPDESARLTPFDVLKQNVTARNSGFGRSVTEIVYTITAFDVGEFTVPPVLITAKDRFGNEKNIRTVGHKVTVSLGTDTKNDIVDISPPMDVTERTQYFKKALSYLPYILPLLALVIVIVYLLTRREEKVDVNIDPRAEALNHLSMLKLDGDNMDALYFKISEILRTFFHEHLKVDASKMTSREILNSMKGPVGMEKVLGDAEELFSDIDLVKFSPYPPSIQDAEVAVLRARCLVREVP